MPVRNITVKNMVVTDARKGVAISRVDGIEIEGLDVETEGVALQIENVTDVVVNGKKYAEVTDRESVSL